MKQSFKKKSSLALSYAFGHWCYEEFKNWEDIADQEITKEDIISAWEDRKLFYKAFKQSFKKELRFIAKQEGIVLS